MIAAIILFAAIEVGRQPYYAVVSQTSTNALHETYSTFPSIQTPDAPWYRIDIDETSDNDYLISAEPASEGGEPWTHFESFIYTNITTVTYSEPSWMAGETVVLTNDNHYTGRLPVLPHRVIRSSSGSAMAFAYAEIFPPPYRPDTEIVTGRWTYVTTTPSATLIYWDNERRTATVTVRCQTPAVRDMMVYTCQPGSVTDYIDKDVTFNLKLTEVRNAGDWVFFPSKWQEVKYAAPFVYDNPWALTTKNQYGRITVDAYYRPATAMPLCADGEIICGTNGVVFADF